MAIRFCSLTELYGQADGLCHFAPDSLQLTFWQETNEVHVAYKIALRGQAKMFA